MIFWALFVPYALAVGVWLVSGAFPDVGNSAIRITGDYAFSACNVVVALYLLRARPRDWLVRVLAVGMLGTAATFNYQSHAFFTEEVLGPPRLVENLHTLLHVVSGCAYLFAVLGFPDGRLPPELPRRALPVKVGLYALAAAQVGVLASSNRAAGHPGQGFFLWFFAITVPLAGVIAQTVKLRTLVREVDRRVARLLRGALIPLLVVGTAFVAMGVSERVGSAVLPALFAVVPVALVVAILRYRLLDIELVVRRALVYSSLVAVLGSAYVATVVLIGSAWGATAVVAVAFDPLRRRLQLAANQLVYGRRVAPYEALSLLAASLGDVVAVEEVLPRLARNAAEAVGAVGGVATVLLPDGSIRTASWGDEGDETQRCDVRNPSVLGWIEVRLPRGHSLDRGAKRMLRHLATQAAPALAAVRSEAALRDEIATLSRQAVELRQSQRRLARARVDARREVERAIARRVLPRLAEVGDALERDRLDIDAARRAATEALEELRAIAHGVFPSVLADQGLAAALRSTTFGRPVRVTGVRRLRGRRLPPAVESGAYFCLAHAFERADGPLRVHLGIDDASFWFRVDGPGARAGQQLVADRVAALDGELVAEREGFRARLPVTRPLAA